MKTKHIVFALALPAIFAACSQEELVTPNNPSTSEIKGVELGSDFTFSVSENPETRASLDENGKMVWDAVDKIGMVWVSNSPSSLASPANDFSTLTALGKVLSNHPLYNESGKFASKTMVFEGQYWACFPYQGNVTSTEVLSLPVKEEQNLDFTNAQSDVLKENTYFLTRGATIKLKKDEPTKEEKAAGVIQAGVGNTLSFTLDAFSNRLLLNISVKGSTKVKAEDVVVKSVKMMATKSATSVLRKAAEFDFTKGYPTVDADKVSYKLIDNGIYLNTSSAVVEDITVKNTKEVALGASKKATTIISYLPTFLAADGVDALTLVVETNFGDITYVPTTSGWAKPVANKDDTKIESAGVAADFAGLSNKIGSYATRNIVIDMNDAKVTGKTAKNAAELISIVNTWKIISTAPLTVTLENTDTEKDETGAEVDLPVTLENLNLSDLPADLTLSAKESIIFKGSSTISSSAKKVAITKATDATGSPTVEIAPNATLNIDGGTVNVGDVTNGLNVTIANNKILDPATPATLFGQLNVYNAGQFVLVDAATDGIFINNGIITIGTDDSNGTITFVVGGSLNNKEVIVKNGTIDTFEGGNGIKRAVVSNAISFASVVDAGVTDIEVNGVVNLGVISFNSTNAGKANITIVANGSIKAGAVENTFSSLTVKANASVLGKGEIAFTNLNIDKDVTLTITDSKITTNNLSFPTGSALVVNGELTYTQAKPVGGSLSGTGKVNGVAL